MEGREKEREMRERERERKRGMAGFNYIEFGIGVK